MKGFKKGDRAQVSKYGRDQLYRQTSPCPQMGEVSQTQTGKIDSVKVTPDGRKGPTTAHEDFWELIPVSP